MLRFCATVVFLGFFCLQGSDARWVFEGKGFKCRHALFTKTFYPEDKTLNLETCAIMCQEQAALQNAEFEFLNVLPGFECKCAVTCKEVEFVTPTYESYYWTTSA